MSRHHQMHANDVKHVVNDIAQLSADEVDRIYGIDLMEDGSVYDPTYHKTFETVGMWAEFSIQQDETEYNEQFGYKQDYDDF